MNRSQAEKLCDEIKALGVPRSAEVVPIGRSHPGHPCGVAVNHDETGNEIGFAATVDEGQHIVRQLKRQFGDRVKV